MNRFMPFVICVLTCALLRVPAGAEDPPKPLTDAERERIRQKAKQLADAASREHRLGNYTEALKKFQEAEALMRRAFNKESHPDGHVFLAETLHEVGVMYQAQGKLAEAEALYKEALEMRRRLLKGDHFFLADSLHHLARLYQDQGKFAEAEPLHKDALAMRKRLYKGDHADVAATLNNLAFLYQAQGKFADAEPLYADALEMHKRLYKRDHPAVATSLNNLASVSRAQGKLDVAESLYKESLDMRKRLYKGDHPELARGMNNLASVYWARGELAEAEPLYRNTHEMQKRVFKYDHPDLARGMNKLAFLYYARGKLAEADPLFAGALDVSRRLTLAYAKQKVEGETLTLLASLPLYRDGYLSIVRARAIAPGGAYDPANTYPAVWSAKGTISRVYEQRQLQARAAAADPGSAKALADLADARRRRAELLLAPATSDASIVRQRETELKTLDARIVRLNETLLNRLPAVARINKLNDATSADLQKELPADAALVDFVRYTFLEYDTDRPAGEKEKQTARYLVFVVTRDKVAWVDLDTAAKIEPAVSAWREAITGGKDVPAALPAKVRELVWEKVRKALPASTRTVYVCPDAALCRVPWAVLPGDKPGTILLEDFAVATIPHAPFLLDKLWKQDPSKNPPSGVLVVGGVKYDADLAPAAPAAPTASGDPLVKPGAKLGWSFLPGSAAEATGVSAAANATKLPVTALKDEAATAAAVLAALTKVKVAHLATHGFFADESFRSVFQLDPKDYEQSRTGERIGRAANSPLVMTGVVFAGANNPKTTGRGILTGEALIDLDLSGLELAVLSACETGLGDVAGGEGTFGLQRAFHYAGTKNVVASLWKVPDQSTAALMALFYRNLWSQNVTPMEALRQAQLELYKNPQKIAELAKGFRGKFEEVAGADGETEVKPTKEGTAHPLLWAAFTLSGPGR